MEKKFCLNCKHCRRKGIAYTSPGGVMTLQDYNCTNLQSENYEQVITQVNANGVKNDPREYSTCNNWEKQF